MGISKRVFGQLGQETVYAYTLTNAHGFTAEILNYGGIVRKLIYKGVDVVLGRDSVEEYLRNEGFFGALIGRNANRIANAQFCLNGKMYQLDNNDGKNNLHGGNSGFHTKIWNAEMVDGEEPSLILRLASPDGEEGFPGNVNVTVTYTLTGDNGIRIHYLGESDADTLLNMTNHAFFNLNGHASGVIDGHRLWLDCDFYTPKTEDGIPTGEVLSVKNTPFDFTTEDVIGPRFTDSHKQIKMSGGFDHNIVLNGFGYRKVGKMTGDETGISMEIYTDQKGMQVYSGNMIEKDRICKEGVVYTTHSGICFETQAFPNNTAYSHFPSAVLKKGEKYETVTTYKFI